MRATFSQEAVREFQVLTNSYSAEFGKASGGVVNIVTKSGTNTLAGNLFFFLRDGALNSKDHFERFNPAGQEIDRTKAPYSQKQYGATLGGPLKRDRTFYFLSFERLDIAAHNFVTIDDTNNVTFLGQNFGTPAAILRRAGFAIETGHVPYDVRSNQFLGKLDHQLNPNNSLTARINWANDLNENIEPFGGNVARSRGAVLESEDLMFALSHLWVRSARMVNETRFQVANRDQTVNSLDPKCGGVCTAENQGGPTLEVLGVASVGRQRFTPQPRKNLRYQVLDTVSYLHRPASVQGGVRLQLHRRDRAEPAAALRRPVHLRQHPCRGRHRRSDCRPWRFLRSWRCSWAFRDATCRVTAIPAAPYTYSDFSLFAQDDWRITPRLTAKLGVRYQVQSWPDHFVQRHRLPEPVSSFPATATTSRPGSALVWDPIGRSKDDDPRRVRVVLRQPDHGSRRHHKRHQRTRQSAHARGGAADDDRRVERAGPQASGTCQARIRASSFRSTRASRRRTRITRSTGVQFELPGRIALSTDFIYVRGFKQPSTLDYNPIVPALGPNRRPADLSGVAGTSASVLQVHVIRRNVVPRPLGRGDAAVHEPASADDELHVVEGRRQRHRFPERIHRAGQRPRPRPERSQGPADRIRPRLRKGRRRFRINATALSRAARTSCRRTSSCRRLSRSDRAGRTTSWPASISTEMETAARPIARGRRCSDAATSIAAQRRHAADTSERGFAVGATIPAGRMSVDAIFEVFNLFNRSNFTQVNNVFGTGAYPTAPLPTFGQFTQAAPPRQMQLAVKIGF